MRSVVLFLYRGSPVFDYDRAVWATARDGELITEVYETGELRLPGVEPAEEAQWLSRASTIGQLRFAAEREPVSRVVD
jgi:hypothetical protein